ncbi:glycosyltransferase family 2 protein [Flavobacterium sp.]|uniref:glycosyltransferase family 2 protein n=1 Tax=Flavobacterium sp. TaxID=239 RepID=UPI002B7278BA|nr:glycosyltransferase family 2 protein [Flavobacterium sp.]HQA73965.1 glycosyltransferase family 2 protein [Flavobacterium sp.]
MKLSVIITTYNSEEWLRKVLIGFSIQTFDDFEIIIADDGSTNKTKAVINEFSSVFKYPIQHVWQEDDGFRKSEILNKAILNAKTKYLLFTDGDCIPRNDFVAVHYKYKQKGYFLSGGYFKLPLTISNAITTADIVNQNCFSIFWLNKNGLKLNFKISKLTKSIYFAKFMNWITPTKRSWNGHNSSAYKNDILAVNGFNHEMKYGGMDRELGERMFNNGMLSKQIRYSAICLHLDHSRGYSTPEVWEKNNAIRNFNKKNKIIKIENGIDKIDS